MTQLFGRSAKLTIGSPTDINQAASVAFTDQNAQGRDVSGFDFEFVVEKNLKPEPNTLDLRVYNLGENTRRSLEGSQKLTVKLEAGYQGETELLWLGEARAAWSTREGPDVVTHIEAGDGEQAHRSSRIQLCYGPKIPVQLALQAIAQALGVGLGNVNQALSTLTKKGLKTLNGTISGSAARRLTDFCRSAGMEWSIQNGAIQLLDLGGLSTGTGFLLSSSTGMIGSPTVDNNGIVSASCLITPGIIPGCLVSIDGEFMRGSYRVERCRWYGQTWGQDWNIDMECRKYKGVT